MPTTITRTDPLRNFKFSVQLIPKAGSDANDTLLFGGTNSGSLTIGFAAVSGISVQNEVIPYREGGMNTHNHKMVGQSDFAPVTFSRGVFANQPQMWRWQQYMHRWNQANPGENIGSNGSATDYRCDIIVKVHDHPVTVDGSNYVNDASRNSPASAPAKLAYRLFNCWPGGYALGDLNAGESSIIVQQLTVHHEGFVVAWDDKEIAALA